LNQQQSQQKIAKFLIFFSFLMLRRFSSKTLSPANMATPATTVVFARRKLIASLACDRASRDSG